MEFFVYCIQIPLLSERMGFGIRNLKFTMLPRNQRAIETQKLRHRDKRMEFELRENEQIISDRKYLRDLISNVSLITWRYIN
jgi:hypothetical protein